LLLLGERAVETLLAAVEGNGADITRYGPFPNTVHLKINPPDTWDTENAPQRGLFAQ
jgi:hypothetical protein